MRGFYFFLDLSDHLAELLGGLLDRQLLLGLLVDFGLESLALGFEELVLLLPLGLCKQDLVAHADSLVGVESVHDGLVLEGVLLAECAQVGSLLAQHRLNF